MIPYGPWFRTEIVTACHLGWKVFPLRGDGTKRPAIKGWRDSATSDAQKALDWFHELEARGMELSLGLATGEPSGVFVLDGDTPEAVDWIVSRFAKEGPNVLTSRGGHFYFRLPKTTDGVSFPVKNSASRIYEKVDVRGTGGLVVLPPSGKKSGGFYEWKNRTIYEPSEELLLLVRPAERLVLPAATPRTFASETKLENYVDRVVRRAIQEAFSMVGTSQEGKRNEILYSQAFRMGSLSKATPKHSTDLHRAAQELGALAVERGLPRSEGYRTAEDAYQRGMALGEHPGFAVAVAASSAKDDLSLEDL